MSGKVKLTITPAVAAYVRSGTPPEVKLSGFRAAESMAAPDRVMLLFCLSKDADPEIRRAALSSLEGLPADIILEYRSSADPHPLVLDVLPSPVSEAMKEVALTPPSTDIKEEDISEIAGDQTGQDTTEPEEEAPVDEEDEEFLSKYKMAQIMGIGEKIKMALTGDKEWRSILVKDANKLVSGSVIKNPRITEGEIHTLIKAGIQNDEIMRLICANKEWIKNYKIRKALIENNRTPIQNAVRYLGTMNEKDLASFAKSKNIASVISTMAKRLLLNKKK